MHFRQHSTFLRVQNQGEIPNIIHHQILLKHVLFFLKLETIIQLEKKIKVYLNSLPKLKKRKYKPLTFGPGT